MPLAFERSPSNGEPMNDTRVRVTEMVAVAVMGMSSVATAWSSYQAALWSGVQSTSYSEASALRVESSRASGAGDAHRAVDVATFMGWIEAYARDETALADFYQSRLRDEFRPAFDAWLATGPRTPGAAPTPFQRDEYRLREYATADSLVAEAEAAFARGRDANEWGDRYVLTLVLFASVLFLTGLAQTAKNRGPRAALLSLSFLLFLGGAYGLLVLPRL